MDVSSDAPLPYDKGWKNNGSGPSLHWNLGKARPKLAFGARTYFGTNAVSSNHRVARQDNVQNVALLLDRGKRLPVTTLEQPIPPLEI